MTPHYPSANELEEARAGHLALSPAAAEFLDYVMGSPERVAQLRHLADSLPPWTRTYASTQLTWPTFVGAGKLRQMRRAVEKLCGMVKSLPRRIFGGDPRRISDFYRYGDASLMGLLLDEPNGIKGAIGRCDFIDSPAGFKCCEVNMSASVGGLESRFWERRYLTHPTVSAFVAERGIRPAHHDSLQSLCNHVVEDTSANGICDGGVLNVAVMYPAHATPGEAGVLKAQEVYSDMLRAAGAAVRGRVVFCGGAGELSVKGCSLYHGDLRIHAVLNYIADALPQQIYWCHKAGTLSLYNGALTAVMSDKRNLALLSEFGDTGAFDEEERQIIRDHVPWSRVVVEGETTRRGETVSFPDFLLASRDDLVLKLGIGHAGKDIFVGRFTPPDEWERRVREAIGRGGWMVQEYVEGYPYLYADGEGNVSPQNVVWGLFCFGSRYGGGYLRMLPRGVRRGVVNSGGGAVEGPIFEV